MNIDIKSATTQQATAAQITALATHILHRCGDVDFTGTDLTVTPPTDMNAYDAGIIVKCASENNGTVNIEGATEITDEEWEEIKQYGAPLWMVTAVKTYGIPLANLVKAYGSYGNVVKQSFVDDNVYIKGDGASYFVLNYIPNLSNIKVVSDYIGYADGAQYRMLFGACTTGDVNGGIDWGSPGYWANNTHKSRYFYGNVENQTDADKPPFGVLVHLECVNATAKWSTSSTSGSITVSPTAYPTMTCKMGLMQKCVDNANTASTSSTAKVKRWQFYENDVLLHFVIPCATDTLFDLVTGETLTNQGTGTATLVTE